MYPLLLVLGHHLVQTLAGPVHAVTVSMSSYVRGPEAFGLFPLVSSVPSGFHGLSTSSFTRFPESWGMESDGAIPFRTE